MVLDGIRGNDTEITKPKDQSSQESLGRFRIFSSLPIFGIVLFVFVTTFPPFEVTTEINLGVHMLQHVVIAISGIMIGYPLYKDGRLDRFRSTKFGVAGIFVIASLLIFWHLPIFWDGAVENVYVHVVEHACFLLVGVLIGTCVPMIPDNFKMIVLALTISAHMFYGFSLYLITTAVYPLYSVAQQQTLGIALFAPAPAYFVGYLYLSLTRENRKLESLEFGSKVVEPHGRSLRRLIIPSLSIAMIVALIAYFAITGLIIVTSHSSPGANVSIIYIEESPVNWQYSPQIINVVIGVNNTVEWDSHSFTYDTVTSSTGLFASSSLAPGSTFTYTFTQPGTYDYYCQYHLWMHGSIIVKNP